MKKYYIIILFLFIFSTSFAQVYDLSECIGIALENKRTLVSADLDVGSANEGVRGSYSGVLPSVSMSTSGGKTKYPLQENIIPDLVNLEIDTIKSGESSYMSAGVSINQTIYNGGRSLNSIYSFQRTVDVFPGNNSLQL